MSLDGLADALTVIYDPVRPNLRTTRSVLNGSGFRRIEGFVDVPDFIRQLGDNDVTLIMIEVVGAEVDVPELIQSIRRGDKGRNPFVPIIATTWSGQTDLIAALMNAGADDVLLRPFSVSALNDRVRSIIFGRKDFVITSDYIGPDRGRVGNNALAPGQFKPPNPLRSRALAGETLDLMAEADALNTAKRRLGRDRVSRLARRVAMAAEVTIQASGEGSTSAYVEDMLNTCAELIRAARTAEAEEIDDLASVLDRTASRAAIPGPEQAEHARLTRELALALYLAYASEDAEAFQAELDATLMAVRVRLDKARERAQRRTTMALLG